MSDCKYAVQSFNRRTASRSAAGRHSEVWRAAWVEYDRLEGRAAVF